ncbi:MAG: type II toxin-antitoxin system RelE/ParE family toxin [Patescibacteria group bacterium]
MEVIYATDEVQEFVRELEAPARVQTRRLVSALETHGHRLRMPHSRALGTGLFELRLLGLHPVRLLYCFHNHQAVLLHGIIKKRDALKPSDIAYAHTVRANYIAHI